MDLVDDHGVDRRQPLAGVRRQQEKQRLRRGDEDVGGVAREPRPFDCGCVTGADGNLRRGDREAVALRHDGDSRQRGAQVPLDVDCQRLEGRDVEDPASLLRRRRRLEHQAVECPEKCRERLAAAGRREDQRGLAARDRRPPELLRPGGRRKGAAEPLADRRVKQIEDVPSGHEPIISYNRSNYG